MDLTEASAINDLVDALSNKWREQAFPYQVLWFDDRHLAYRNLLLGRQSGVTMGMAIEAGIISLETGRKQVFMGPTLAHLKVFEYYMSEWFAPVVLKQIRAEFIPAHRVSSQDLSGCDVYIDSYLYMNNDRLDEIMEAIKESQVNRETWISARRKEPRFQLMDAATFKGVEDSMGISISPLLTKRKCRGSDSNRVFE